MPDANTRRRLRASAFIAIALLTFLAFPLASLAEPLAAPGDTRLRHDLQLLNDSGAINIPLTAWPMALGDVHNALENVDVAALNSSNKLAFSRLKQRLFWEMDINAVDIVFGVGAASEPRIIRSFENTLRTDGEVRAKLTWLGERFSINLSATYANNPFDGDEFRPDGTYVGVALGNWIVTAGWQERWWGPGRGGSLILSNNARPFPAISIQRNSSTPFATKWLRWIGPWTLSAFMGQLDDVRTVNDALIFGLRGTFRPVTGLEIGLSRTAQWCGDGRPCDGSTFLDLLVGNDNRGVNVAPEDEPGNQLGGIDIRWSLPGNIPVATYMQWIGEDGRAGGLIGAWLRQIGIEHWGSIGDISHRTYFEVSETSCRQGGFGFSDIQPNCAYNHFIFRTGYRYNGRSIGHPIDGDGLAYSLGSTLVQSAGHTWNATLRYMEIKREGSPDLRHTLSPTPQELVDIQITHERETRFGRFYAGLGYKRLDDLATGQTSSDVSGFIRWSSR